MRLSRLFTMILAAVTAVIVAACSDPTDFTIEGEIGASEGLVVRLTLMTSQSIETFTTQPEPNGKFIFKLSSPGYSLATLRIGSTTVARFVVHNGDKIQLKGPSPAEVKFKWNKPMRQVAKYFAEHPGLDSGMPTDSVNMLIEEYVTDKGPTPAAAFMVMTRYNTIGNEAATATMLEKFANEPALEALVAEVLDMMRLEQSRAASESVTPINIKGAGDSITRYYPRAQSASLLMFTDGANTKASKRIKANFDSLMPRRLRVLDLSVAYDSAEWQRAIERDTVASWSRLYIPAGVSAPTIRRYQIDRIPFYIVSDSTTAQRYRGTDLNAAFDTIRAIINKK